MTSLLLTVFFSAILLQVSSQVCNTIAIPKTTVNAPTFNLNISTLLADVLTMGFDWGRTSTRNLYPAVTTGSCVFPVVPNAWPEPPCFSAFTIQTSFSALVSTPACGSTSADVGNPSSKVWRIPVTMKANETFFDARQIVQNRDLTYNLLIQLGFPDFVTASITITPFAPVLLDAFIISQLYTASAGTATIIFNTVVGWPFMVVGGPNAFATNIPNSQIQITGTEMSGYSAGVVNSIPSLVSTGAGQQSFQTWILTITPPQTACTFTGSYNISGFIIACIPGATCPPINNNQATIVLQIDSENFCAQTSAVIGLSSSLAVYSDPLYTLPGVNFLVDDLPLQTAYFEMVVTSSAVNIRLLQIRNIVVSTTNNQNYLFAFGTPTASVSVYTNGVWVPGINGAVAPDATAAAGHARFRFDVVTALFNIPRDSLTDVLVQVTSQVFYVGSKKRGIESEEVITEFLVDADGNQKEVYSVPVGIRGPKSAVAPETTLGLGVGSINLVFGVAIIGIAIVVVAILVVLVVLLVRRKKDKKNNNAEYDASLQVADEHSIELDSESI